MNNTTGYDVQIQNGLNTLEVLVVDDELTGNVIKETVEQLGHEVVIAECYKEAFQKIAKAHFDLVLWDINLFDGNGIDLISRIRRLAGDLNIVAMTSVSSREIEQKARLQGVIYYMIKPFELDELVSIADHLAKRKIQLCL